jgi:hypothetical protein
VRIPEPEVGLARSAGSARDAADTLGRFRHRPIPPLNSRVRSCPPRARSEGPPGTVMVMSRTDRQACLPGFQHVALVVETSLARKRPTRGRLLPSRYTTPVMRRQPWNIGPERRHHWTTCPELRIRGLRGRLTATVTATPSHTGPTRPPTTLANAEPGRTDQPSGQN